MSYYATAQDMLFVGAEELAQVSSPDTDRVVPAALLVATIASDDRAAWSAEEQAAADEALSRINEAVARAEGKINDALAHHHAVPLTTPDHAVRQCRTYATYIARFELEDDAVGEEVKSPVWTRYQEALRWLAKLAKGEITYTGPENQDIALDGPGRVFSRKSTRGL